MTTPRDRDIPWQTLPEPWQQRLRQWWDDLVALYSLVEFRLGVARQSDPSAPSAFSVALLNAWNPDGPWIPPGRLDLAGEYLEARLRGVAGSAERDLLAAISVPTSDATHEERELAQDIRITLAAGARW